MSKIILKNYEELIVPDETVDFINKELEEKRKAEFPLNHYPVTINHADGLWCGTLNDVASVSSSNKKTVRTKWFSSPEEIEKFHNLYGYGFFKNRYENGYGLVDVKTQFLIKIGKAQFVDNSGIKKLNMIQWKDKEKEKSWADLWEVYERNVDAFNDLVPIAKRICKITE